MSEISTKLKHTLKSNKLTDYERSFISSFEPRYLLYSNKNLKDLSLKFSISTATINRALMKSGLHSWTYTKNLIIRELDNEKINDNFYNQDNLIGILRNKYIDQDCLNRIQEVVKTLKKEKNVIIYSKGFATTLANFFARALLIKGIEAKVMDGSSYNDLIKKVNSKIIYISLSGSSYIEIFENNKNSWLYISGSTNYNRQTYDLFQNSIYPQNIIVPKKNSKDIPSFTYLTTFIILTELINSI